MQSAVWSVLLPEFLPAMQSAVWSVLLPEFLPAMQSAVWSVLLPEFLPAMQSAVWSVLLPKLPPAVQSAVWSVLLPEFLPAVQLAEQLMLFLLQVFHTDCKTAFPVSVLPRISCNNTWYCFLLLTRIDSEKKIVIDSIP